MNSALEAITKYTLKIEVEGTYSRVYSRYDLDAAVESRRSQAVARLEVTVEEMRDEHQENFLSPKILHHTLIKDSAERIRPNEILLPPPESGIYITTFWGASIRREVEFLNPPPYLLVITDAGLELGGVLFSWSDIELNARWPHEDDISFFVNGQKTDRPADGVQVLNRRACP